MGKNSANFGLDPLRRPVEMLALEEGGLVPAHRPAKPVCRAPALFRRHATQCRNLFGTGLFVRQHG